MQQVCAQGCMDLKSSVPPAPSPLEAGTEDSPSRFPAGRVTDVSMRSWSLHAYRQDCCQLSFFLFFLNFGFAGSSLHVWASINSCVSRAQQLQHTGLVATRHVGS